MFINIFEDRINMHLAEFGLQINFKTAILSITINGKNSSR